MKRLETFINEKLKVTKRSDVPDLIALLESTNKEEYNLQCKKLAYYLNNYSYLPVAELKDLQHGGKELARKYQNSNDTFLWVIDEIIFYGTWNEMYYMYWSKKNKCVKNYTYGGGFKSLTLNEQELIKSKGIFILTENNEFLEQIDILIQKSKLA